MIIRLSVLLIQRGLRLVARVESLFGLGRRRRREVLKSEGRLGCTLVSSRARERRIGAEMSELSLYMVKGIPSMPGEESPVAARDSVIVSRESERRSVRLIRFL